MSALFSLTRVLQSRGHDLLVIAADTIPEIISVDGYKRPTRNSLGQLIHPTLEGIKNFWRWFKLSRALDEYRRPIVYFHGTYSDFDKFESSSIGKNYKDTFGFYFTEDTELASIYAESYPKDYNSLGGNVMPVYLKIIKPLYIEDLYKYVKDSGNEEELELEWDSGYNAVEIFDVCKESIGKLIQTKNKDGFLIKYPHIKGTGAAIVLHPNQIKSATGNRGSFDRGSTDVTASTAA